MVDKSFAHCRITEKFGEGGRGGIYDALDTHLSRFIAMIILSAQKVVDPERWRRFLQETNAASALNRPNIVTVNEFNEAEGFKSYESGEAGMSDGRTGC